jgi:hypothetical protein
MYGMGEDLTGGLGPGERLATVVPAVGEPADRGCELADGAERAAPDGLAGDDADERWFGYLTAKMIRRGMHKSVQALEAHVRAWIEHWNAHLRPFAWTKTADEILDSLANI